MNKEKLLELFSLALDKNCSITLHFSQYQNNGKGRVAVFKEEAHSLIEKFADALGTESIKNNEGQLYADDFHIDFKQIRVAISYIPSKEEKKAGLNRVIAKLEQQLAELKKEEEELV